MEWICFLSKKLWKGILLFINSYFFPHFWSWKFGLFFQRISASQFPGILTTGLPSKPPRWLSQIKPFCGSYIIDTWEPSGKILLCNLTFENRLDFWLLLNEDTFFSITLETKKKISSITLRLVGKWREWKFHCSRWRFWYWSFLALADFWVLWGWGRRRGTYCHQSFSRLLITQIWH